MSARLYVAIGIMAILVVLWVAAYSWTTEETFEQQENDDKFLIYASFFPYYEFTKNIVGEKAEIVQFIPSGSQTHEWAPSIMILMGMEPYVHFKASKGILIITRDFKLFMAIHPALPMISLLIHIFQQNMQTHHDTVYAY